MNESELGPDDRRVVGAGLDRLNQFKEDAGLDPSGNDPEDMSNDELESEISRAANAFDEAYGPLLFVKFFNNNQKGSREFGPYTDVLIEANDDGDLSAQAVDTYGDGDHEVAELAVWTGDDWSVNDGMGDDPESFAHVKVFRKTPGHYMTEAKAKLTPK